MKTDIFSTRRQGEKAPVTSSIEIQNAKKFGYGPPTSLYIENGIIVEQLTAPADRVIDAQGYAVFPGLIDGHCHLREPGFEYREDIVSGTKSAAKGGITSVMAMPNTRPVCDNAAVVRSIVTKAAEEGYAHVFPIGAVSKNLDGKELAEFGLMKEAGIVAVSDDGKPIATADLLRKALLYASDFGLPVLNHCEEMSISEGAMNEGAVSTALGLRGIPAIAEDIMIARDIQTAEYLRLPIHICHVSTLNGVRMIREAKRRGVKVTAETCPHYFTLTDSACEGFDVNAKMSPPLRSEEDRKGIIEGIGDGTIDLIVTDHAPHHSDEKDVEFALSNNGIIGFETLFPLAYTYLIRSNLVSAERVIDALTVNPSQLFGLQRGTLDVGAPADIAIFDLETPFTYDKNQSYSKSRNTPFHGFTLYGKTKYTICEGRITYEELC